MSKSSILLSIYLHSSFTLLQILYNLYIYINSWVVSCIKKSAWCPLTSEQSSTMQNVSQWKTTSASFINTWSFMPLLDNHQLKMVGDGWWLTSNDMKIEVLIKEALVVFHWLMFCIVYIARFCVFFWGVFTLLNTTY